MRLSILIGLFLTGCGSTYSHVEVIHTSCTVTKQGSVSTISCPDGSNVTVVDGQPGTSGPQGPNGHSTLISQGSADASLCPTGGIVLSLGLDTNDDGVLDTAETSQIAKVCNGLDGSDGLNAPPTPFTPVGLVDPCGTNPSIHNEVFLRLSNGQLLASFSDNVNGYNTRFSVLSPQTYVTTDGDSCQFTINSNGDIVNENHHY